MCLDNRIDLNDPQEETETFKCKVCEAEISKEGICNSRDCFEADSM